MRPQDRKHRKLCIHCRRKNAGYFNPDGKWRFDRQHTLCHRCHRSQFNSAMAQLLIC
jgi:hypothetical protein